MFWGLNRGTTETGQGDRQTKGHKTLCGVENAMGDLPTEVNNLTVKIKEVKGAPRGRPVKGTKDGSKLRNTIRGDSVFRKKVRVANFGGHERHRRAMVGEERSKNQGAERRGKRAINSTPRDQK